MDKSTTHIAVCLLAPLAVCLGLSACAAPTALLETPTPPVPIATPSAATTIPTVRPTPALPPLMSTQSLPCATQSEENRTADFPLEHRELRKPYQRSGGQDRYTLSVEELNAYLEVFGIESLCLPADLGAPFVNADWDNATNSATTGRMLSLGFENLYQGAGWSDVFIVYATYNFATGTEYDRFARPEDRDALRNGTLPDVIEVNGVQGFVRFQPADLCFDTCTLYKTIVFPFATDYIAIVCKVGDYGAGTDWNALAQALRAGEYPGERQAQVAMTDWLAQSIHFRRP